MRRGTTNDIGKLRRGVAGRRLMLRAAGLPGCRAPAVWLLTTILSVLACELTPDVARASAPLLSARRTFYIPFTVGIARPGEATPEEVHLYVSGDGGRSWHFYQRQPPDAGRFVFHAGQDGEHWFAVQTIEDAQSAQTPQSLQPELKVIIDTQQPELDLAIEATADGEIGVRWTARDAQLDPVTFRLEYKSATSTLWQPLPVQKPVESRADYSGEHRWRPVPPATALQVRAEISDRCGNVASLVREIGAQGQPQVTTPLPLPGPTPQGPTPQGPNSPLAQSAFPNAPLPNAAPPQDPAHHGASDTQPPTVVWQAEPTTQPPIPHHAGSQEWTAPSNIPGPTSPADDRQMFVHMPTPSMTAAPTPNPLPPTAGQDPSAFSGQTAPSSAMAVPEATALPMNVRMSNSRRFELDYIVETAVNMGVERVELWYTRDGGQSWTLYGEDPDRQTPFLVEMDQDGLFGYKIVAQTQQGIGSGPPRPGTVADICIQIDATPPVGRLTAARFGRGDAIGTLQIYWESHDDHPATHPVTLLYGETVHGPWRVIADGLAAQGRYDWRVGDNVPAEFYLRLEVRDQAGNVFDDTLTDAIASNGLAPQTRIRGVRPAPETAPSQP